MALGLDADLRISEGMVLNLFRGAFPGELVDPERSKPEKRGGHASRVPFSADGQACSMPPVCKGNHDPRRTGMPCRLLEERPTAFPKDLRQKGNGISRSL